MNYLNHSTLKAFLYLLYGKDTLLLSDFRYLERQGLINDIFSNELEDLFVLRNSEVETESFSFNKITDYPYDISPGMKTLELMLPASSKEKLLDFVSSYINTFKEKKELDSPGNYYPYDKSYKESMELLKPSENHGKKFNFKMSLNDKSPFAFFKNDIRFLDILFYFILQEYIRINIDSIYKVMHKVSED